LAEWDDCDTFILKKKVFINHPQEESKSHNPCGYFSSWIIQNKDVMSILRARNQFPPIKADSLSTCLFILIVRLLHEKPFWYLSHSSKIHEPSEYFLTTILVKLNDTIWKSFVLLLKIRLHQVNLDAKERKFHFGMQLSSRAGDNYNSKITQLVSGISSKYVY
jgi:hypothetical protein